MDKDRIIRCITKDGSIMVSAVDATTIAYKGAILHKTSPVATVALGRLLTASSLMGNMLKQENASITLRMNGDGPLGVVIAVSDSKGNCRGYVENPQVETTYTKVGKINVANAVGRKGILNVMKDYGSGDPYIGQVEIVSGEIAEDITHYYAKSEQTPTVCSLGVLVDKKDSEVILAGGMLLQLLPGAAEDVIDKIEENLKSFEPMTTMLAKGMTLEEICQKAVKGFTLEVLDEYEIDYICKCSREKVINSIKLLPDDDIRSLADELGYARANCHFCNKNYRFTKKQLEEIIKSKSVVVHQDYKEEIPEE